MKNNYRRAVGLFAGNSNSNSNSNSYPNPGKDNMPDPKMSEEGKTWSLILVQMEFNLMNGKDDWQDSADSPMQDSPK